MWSWSASAANAATRGLLLSPAAKVQWESASGPLITIEGKGLVLQFLQKS